MMLSIYSGLDVMQVTVAMQRLLDHLPLHAEEGPIRESINEEVLIRQIGDPAGAVVVALVRRVFESMVLLDSQELRKGAWAFVSFPASLLARSLVATWAVPGQTLVENSYWESDHWDAEVIEQQRQLLRLLETGRKRFHPSDEACPIRFVHVAWGIVRLGSHFLMHRREDKSRPDAKGFVFPGGRLKPADLPEDLRKPEILRDLAQYESTLARRYLPATLARELKEELGLLNNEDYHPRFWRTLQPYCAVEGAENKHAFTLYNFDLFSVVLTEQGEIRLLRKLGSDPTRLLWFSLEELIEGKRPDGASAFIDALRADMGHNLKELLDTIPDSSGTSYQFKDENEAVELPEAPGHAFWVGRTGRQKEHLRSLDDWGWELLLLLGWCGRGFPVKPNSNRVLVLGGGWLQLLLDEDVTAAKRLAFDLARAGLPVIQHSSEALRLAVTPDQIYFAANCFSYAYRQHGLQESRGQIDLVLNSVQTKFGDLEERAHSFPIPPNLADLVEAILAGRDPMKIEKIKNAGDLPKQNRESITTVVRDLGLRQFIRMPGSEKGKNLQYFITVPARKQ